MSWTDKEKERVFASVKPVICSKDNGTAFPIYAGQDGVWYVTCAHVIKSWNQKPGDVVLGGIQAERVIDGLAQTGIDLALILVKTEQFSALELCSLSEPPKACQIPGCYHPGDLKSFLREPRKATLGARSDLISPDGKSEMQGWTLEVKEESILVGGYSGSPVVCASTGRVFAVAVMRTDGGKGGIAISIANLRTLLPDELKPYLTLDEPEPGAIDILGLLTRCQSRLSCPDIRNICQKSSPPGMPLDWLKGGSVFEYLKCLSDFQGLFANNRSPLYDVLSWLEPLYGPEERPEIQAAKRQLERCNPSLDTSALSLNEPGNVTKIAVVEVRFIPQEAQGNKHYDVESYWWAEGSDLPCAGPRCQIAERSVQAGADAALCEDVGIFTKKLLEALDQWDAGCQFEAVFLFRLPPELLHYPFERWPKSARKLLGREHAVALAAQRRPGKVRNCSKYWNGITDRMESTLKHSLWFWFCEHGSWPENETESEKILLAIERHACLFFTKVPDTGFLQETLDEGLAIALWPRHADAEQGFKDFIQERLQGETLANLRFILRDWRKSPDEHKQIVPHLALLWDDPGLILQPAYAGLN